MMRRLLDWVLYLGVAVLAVAVLLPFARPEWAVYRGWIALAGIVLVVVWPLSRVGELRRSVGGRALRYGVNTGLMILLLLGVIGLVEALSLRHNWRWDLTQNKRHSLSPQTIKILGSLPTDVSAIGFFRTDQPTRRFAEDLLQQYARFSNDRFTWRTVDPDREPGLARRYGIEAYGTVVLETKVKSEKVLDAEEERLTNALVKVTREGKRIVYVVQGHGERALDDSERAGFSEAKAAMEKANYEVKPLALARSGRVPTDAALVLLPGPRSELFAPELEALDGYVRGGGKLLVMVDPFQNEGLIKFLERYGLEVAQDLVVEENPIGRLFGIGPEVPIVQQYEPHAITRQMSGLSTLFPLTRSIRAAKTPPKGVAVAALAQTSPQSWGETDRSGLDRGEARPDPQDPKGPLAVAMVATVDKARVVLYGTSSLAANQFLNLQGNRDFFLNTVSWLAEEEDQISIRPRSVNPTPVFMNPQQAQAVFLLPVVILPGLVLLGGIVVVLRRRSEK